VAAERGGAPRVELPPQRHVQEGVELRVESVGEGGAVGAIDEARHELRKGEGGRGSSAMAWDALDTWSSSRPEGTKYLTPPMMRVASHTVKASTSAQR
jgi:hypothetical protein